jgi:preprotein translocase subunit YajC
VDPTLLIVLLIGVMYLVLVVPRRRQMARQRQLLSSLAPGDDVVTIGGIHGTITDVDATTVHLAVSPGVEIRLVRDAVARKVAAVAADDAGEAGGHDSAGGGLGNGPAGDDTPRDAP